jgi:hypothetical protein
MATWQRVAILVHKDTTKIGGYERLANYLVKATGGKLINILETWYDPLDYDYVIALDDISSYSLPLDSPCTLYMTTPRRSFYDMYYFSKRYMRPLIWLARPIDRYMVRKINDIVSISHNVRNRVYKYYQKESDVIYPCIEVDKYRYEEPEDYWLVPQRIDAKWKRTEMIVGAFKEMPETVRFTVNASEDALIDLYAKCKGVITMGIDEDFGYVPIEAMASGKLTIAPYEGGYIETLGAVGMLINPKKEALIEAVRSVSLGDKIPLRDTILQAFAKRYDYSLFKQQWLNHIKINIEHYE